MLTHHWLVRIRGGEKVLLAFRELFPDAPIHTLVYDATECAAVLGSATVRTSWLQRLPGATRRYPLLLPIMPHAFASMRLPDADVILCSDAALAKAMTAPARSTVICYCHSPMRYAFEPTISAEYAARLPRPLRPLWPAVCRYVRTADVNAAKRVNHFIANSRTVADRIKRHYNRESTVIYPPVDVPVEPWTAARDDFYLCAGHHVSYKRLDLAVAACAQLGRRLIVIGDGPEVTRIQKTQFGNPATARWIEFRGWQPCEVLVDAMQRARGLLFPGEEDFGITPVEAMAHGCPVIAYGVGGAAETVLDAVTGILFREQTRDSLIDGIERAERIKFDPITLHARAWQFRKARFLDEIRTFVRSLTPPPT